MTTTRLNNLVSRTVEHHFTTEMDPRTLDKKIEAALDTARKGTACDTVDWSPEEKAVATPIIEAGEREIVRILTEHGEWMCERCVSVMALKTADNAIDDCKDAFGAARLPGWAV